MLIFSAAFLFILLYIGYMHKLNYCKIINIGSNILLRYKQGNIELAMKTFHQHFITYNFVTRKAMYLFKQQQKTVVL